MDVAPQHNVFPEERRLATVMFADVQGFTALAEQLDAETVSDLIKDIWSRLDAVIEDGGGYIDKHMGDGVLAFWGAPSAGERDAQSAVEVALKMQDALAGYLAVSTVEGVKDLRLRIGINTGQVFATYIGIKHEYTVIGDTVNVANRLEQAAEGGGILVGEGTYQLVRNEYEGSPIPPVLARGKAEPITAYKLEVRQESRSTKVDYESGERLETRMVGRDGELARLRRYYTQAENAVVPVMVLVTGEVGIGKSRLLLEFSKELIATTSDSRVVSVRGLAQMARVPFYLWRLVMLGLLGIREDESLAQARRKYMQKLKRTWGENTTSPSLDEAAFRVAGLIGLEAPPRTFKPNPAETPEEAQEKAFEQTRKLFCRLARRERLVLVADDLHWADRETLALLSHIVKPGAEPLPMLILAGSRLSLLRDYPQWWNASHIMTLAPLPISSELVASAYPDLETLPRHLLIELATRAEGNPYFLEEIVKGLLKSGISANEDPQATIDRLHKQIPESLRATLQARLDSLSREARTCALMASVVGRVFWVGALVAIARVNPGTGTLAMMPENVMERLIQDGLRQLVRAELVFPRSGTKFSREQEFIFKNSYLREVAYGLIPKRSLGLYHRAVARWMAQHDDGTFNVMAAEHFEQAEDFFFAAEQYQKAIDLANQRGAMAEAESIRLRAQASVDRTRQGGK
jgi:class 3 adenylate cyclase